MFRYTITPSIADHKKVFSKFGVELRKLFMRDLEKKLFVEEVNYIHEKFDIAFNTALSKIGMEGSKASQQHGFAWENSIREDVFDLPREKNNTDKHDIPKEKNKYDNNENCSIKTTGSSTIFCSSIENFYEYDFSEKNTIIVVWYTQMETEKILKRIYEIDYNQECHKLLFGDLPLEEIKKYVKGVKSIPAKVKGEEAIEIFDYKKEKKILEEKYTFAISINPKVDSSQSRVQCSVNFKKNLKDYITYESPAESANLLRGKEIISKIKSSKRKRNKKLKQ